MFRKIYVVALLILNTTLCLCSGMNNSPKQLSVFTDRDVYIAGDWVYFSVSFSDPEKAGNDFLYLSVNSNKSQQIFSGCFIITDNTANGSFYLSDTLVSGIYQLVSYTNEMRNFGESCFAVKNIMVVNRFDTDINKITANAFSKADSLVSPSQAENITDSFIQLNKVTYSQREQVKLNIRLQEAISDAQISISVRKLAPVSFPNKIIPAKSAYSTNQCNYLPERSGFIIQGQVNDSVKSSTTVFLSCEDSIANLQYANINDKGEFRFFLNPYYFGKKVYIKLEKESQSPITIESKYYNNMVGSALFQVDGDLKKYVQLDQKYLGIQKSFNQNYRQEESETWEAKGWRPEVYARKGVVIKPAEYIYLPDFRAIAHELLLYYKIRERQNDFVGTLIDINQREFSVPYLFLDGVLLEHVRQIIFLDSRKVKSVVTIPNTRFLGNLHMPGILDVASNNAEIEKVQWRYPVATVNVEYPIPKSTYSVNEIEKIPRQIPVFLPLLYWNPALKVESGSTFATSFYTSDCTGTFEIIIRGFYHDGKEIHLRKLFEVTSKNI